MVERWEPTRISSDLAHGATKRALNLHKWRRAHVGGRTVSHLPIVSRAEETLAVAVPIHRIDENGQSTQNDLVAVEEPLEIQLRCGGQRRVVSVTMRTPGQDHELAVGFLFTEGILSGPKQVAGVHSCKKNVV